MHSIKKACCLVLRASKWVENQPVFFYDYPKMKYLGCMKFFTVKLLRIIFWLMLVAFLIVSSIPNDTISRTVDTDFVDFRLDYLLHFVAYAFIAIMACIAYQPNWKVFLLLVLFAMAEEGHQYWVPSRTLNPIDFFFDVVGLLSGTAIVYFFRKKRRR